MHFFAFFIVSLGLHGTVLWAYDFLIRTPDTKIKESAIVPLALDLQSFQIVSTLKETEPKQEPYTEVKKSVPQKKHQEVQKSTHKKILELPKELDIPKQAQMMDNVAEPMKSASVIQEPLTVGFSTQTHELLLSKIQAAIIAHKHYPKRAQREAIEGEVHVSFLWTKEGIKGLKIKTPSAHKLLNEYALELVRIASEDFPEVDEAMEIEVPIGFSLRSI